MVTPLLVGQPHYLNPAYPRERVRQRFRPETRIQIQMVKSILTHYPAPKISLFRRCCSVAYGYTNHILMSISSVPGRCSSLPVFSLFVGGVGYTLGWMALALRAPGIENLYLYGAPVITGCFASVVVYATVRILATTIFEVFSESCLHHTLSEARRTPWLEVLKKDYAKKLAREFMLSRSRIVDFKKIHENAKLDDLHDDIVEFIDEVGAQCPQWKEMTTRQQKHIVSEKLEKAFNAGYQADEHNVKTFDKTGELYKSLMDRLCFGTELGNGKLFTAHTLAMTTQVMFKTAGEDKRENHLLSLMHEYMYGVPSLEIFMSMCFYELISYGFYLMKPSEKLKNLRSFCVVPNILHKTTMNHIDRAFKETLELSRVENGQKVVQTTRENAGESSVSGSVHVRRKKGAKTQIEEPALAVREKKFVEFSDEIKRAVDSLSDHANRSPYISKCCEKIQDCNSWDDLRMQQSCDRELSARVKGGNTSLPVYHKSSGIRGNKGNRKATLFFTRVNDSVEPIALAEHVGQGSAEYRVVKCCKGWTIPQKRIRLNEPLEMQYTAA